MRNSHERGRPRNFDTEKALDAAMLVFWRHGYEGASLAALTRAMRISGTSLYNAFGDKRSLFDKALSRYWKHKAVYLPTALSEPTITSAIDRMFSGAIELAINPKHPDGCLLVHGALATAPDCAAIQKVLSERRAMAEAALARRLEAARATGELDAAIDVSSMARFLITVVWGMSVQAAGGADRRALESIAEWAKAAVFQSGLPVSR